jgi:hypothetical protein
MQKNPLLGISLAVVCVIVLASFTNVVSVQTVESSNPTAIKGDIDQKDLLFQTILDFMNNKEIQNIIQNSEIKGNFERFLQMSGAKLFLINPRMRFNNVSSSPHILTKRYLEYAYTMGVILSRTLDASKIHSLLEHFHVNTQGMQKEIAMVIEKNTKLNKEIGQLSDVQCDCENSNTIGWNFPGLCLLLYPIWYFSFIIWMIFHSEFFGALLTKVMDIGLTLHCFWS